MAAILSRPQCVNAGRCLLKISSGDILSICSLGRSDITLYINTTRLKQSGRHFADDIFKWIFLNENFRISNTNMFLGSDWQWFSIQQATNHYLNQCWPGCLTLYGVTRLRLVNSLRPSDAYASVNYKLTIIGSDNGLSPGRRQAIIWTNAGILLIGPIRMNFSEILSEIHSFSFKKMHLKMSSAKWRPFCFGLSVLRIPHMIIKLARRDKWKLEV